MTTVLVTGGAGFVGSTLALHLKQYRERVRVIVLDSLRRRGSELNVPRLRTGGVEFVHGDVRNRSDLEVGNVDCVIDCAAEPSVLAGFSSSPDDVLGPNLIGTLNTLEVARRHGADVIFLSTSRVYPHSTINALSYVEAESRVELAPDQAVPGVSPAGFSESFPTVGPRSLYGASKLAAELILAEYVAMYQLRGVINRCGVIAGPWQMGKVDQGFVTYWAARHVLGGHLSYRGFGGTGKQVRDVLHVDDLCRLVEQQMDRLDDVSGQTFNVGGGRAVSVSLRELTDLCARLTGVTLNVGAQPETHPADVRLYLSDCRKVQAVLDWTPALTVEAIVEGILAWITDNRTTLAPILV